MYFNYNGVRIFYEYQGKGPLLVLLHGWGVDSSTFSSLCKKLEDSFTLLTVDFPGFGRSDSPVFAWTLESYVDSLHLLLESQQITTPLLLAHSFGGRVAILYEQKYETKKLILVSSAGLRRFSFKTNAKILKYKIKKRFFSLFSKKKLHQLVASSGSADYQNASPVMKKTMSLVISKNLKSYIKKIKTPTLLLWGSGDKATPFSDGLSMHRWIKGSKLIPFYNSTHFCYLEEEDKFVTIIKKEGNIHD